MGLWGEALGEGVTHVEDSRRGVHSLLVMQAKVLRGVWGGGRTKQERGRVLEEVVNGVQSGARFEEIHQGRVLVALATQQQHGLLGHLPSHHPLENPRRGVQLPHLPPHCGTARTPPHGACPAGLGWG